MEYNPENIIYDDHHPIKTLLGMWRKGNIQLMTKRNINQQNWPQK